MPLWSLILSISECKYKGKMEMQRQMHLKIGFYALNAAFIILNAAVKRDFLISECKYKGMQRHRKSFLKCGIYLLNAALKRDLSQRQRHRKNLFYALNAAFISWMRLWSLICRFQKANTKAKWKSKGKCIGKCFLCPKCGIYLLNAALKRDFFDFRMQIQRQMQRQRQMHRKMVFMP